MEKNTNAADLFDYEALNAMADRLETAEICHQYKNRSKRGADLDSIRRVDLHCASCDDSQSANCADTVRTFAAMHMGCRVRALVIG